jgi:hypothetical protein
MLRFCPERQNEGDYEIHPGPHGGVERGRTNKVKAVPQDEENEPASMLTQFPTRYIVFTTASDRHGRQLAWLVGLNSYLTRAASSTSGRAKKQIPAISRIRGKRLPLTAAPSGFGCLLSAFPISAFQHARPRPPRRNLDPGAQAQG